MVIENRPSDDDNTVIPEYLKRWSGLYMREGDKIVEALPEDIEVAKSYPSARSKGTVVAGCRITIMCRKDTYRISETVRVIHVFEVLEPGQEIFIMGPKMVFGEYVDGRAVTPERSGEPGLYDGPVLDSPGVDYNYDITAYSFAAPGRHTIHWQMGGLYSNTIKLEIVTS